MHTGEALTGLRDRRRWLEEAGRIAGLLQESRLATPEGNVAWVGPTGYGSELHPLKIRQLRPHLYDGTCGVALFLAAYARITGNEACRELSLRTLAPLRGKLVQLAEDRRRADALQLPLGGLIGLGSFIYTFLKVAEWLDFPSLIREAHAATLLITAERIARDRKVRVQTGCAGALLALLALHRKAPGPNREGKTPLDLALGCARHLEKNRVSLNGLPRAWPLSQDKPPLAGFSYGAAGISYALLRLYEITRNAEVYATAQEGLAFVDHLYRPDHGSWEDIRSYLESRYRLRRGEWRDWWASGTLDDLVPSDDGLPGSAPAKRYLEMWCHGSAGIVLGRIAALHLDDRAEIRHRIDTALEHLRSYSRPEHFERIDVDDLCCGYAGLIDVLLVAWQTLGEEPYRHAAETLMDRVVERARGKGHYELSAARGRDVFAPSLFQGIAGVGYTLLRLAAPDELPSLLVLD